ncbi:MAG: hypothetical protein Q9218_002530 [Villophora microphyllina]
MATVIIGAGIIGTSAAYYLSQSRTPPPSIHLVESSPELFASASGYAAGFLARDWFSGATASLGRLSFDLHRELAKEHNGYEKWGYSRSTATSLVETIGGEEEKDWLDGGTSRAKAAKRIAESDGTQPAWLAPRHGRPDIIDKGDGTAQVDPYELCQFLLAECKNRGVKLHQPAKVINITRDSFGALSSTDIVYNKSPDSFINYNIPCTRLVLAAGAWTPQVFTTLFPNSKLNIPISSLAGHSLLLRSPHWPPPSSNIVLLSNNPQQPPCHALFTSDPIGQYAPELFSRLPSGHIYIAGLNGQYPLPKLATERVIDPEAIKTLKGTAERLLGKGEFKVERESLCFRPVTGRGVPIIGPATRKHPTRNKDREDGVWIAAGHGPWGISLSLGTGKVVAEMLDGKETSADVLHLGL